MKLSYIFVFVVILCMVMPTMATPTISGGIPTFNASINITSVTIAGVMNQTINMTANMTTGNAATINVNATFTGLPGTLADVVNIGTVSAALLDFTIPAGSSGSSVDTSQFYFINTTRSLTGEKITRDVDNDLLSLYGGNAIAGGTGIISLYGKTSANPNDVEVVAGDGGVGNTLITSWRGGTNPLMDMNGYNITGIKTITNASDAVNKSWSENLVWNNKTLTSAINESYAYLPGRSGGQILNGGTNSGDALTLNASANAGGNIVMRLGDGGGLTNISIRNYTDGQVAFINSLGNASFNGNVSAGAASIGKDLVNKTYVDTAIAGISPSGGGSIDIYNISVRPLYTSVFIGYNVNNTLIYRNIDNETAVGFQAGYNNQNTPQTAVGFNAGKDNIATFQTAIGWNAGNNNTGNSQTAVGHYAGTSNTKTSQTAVGYFAGFQNIANYQTAVGSSAGRGNQYTDQTVVGNSAGYPNGGVHQTAMGSSAGKSNTGGYQTAVGSTAGQSNTKDYQTAVGYEAGNANAGGQSTQIGQSAGLQNSKAYQTAIGANSGWKNTGDTQTTVGAYSGLQNSGTAQTSIGYYSGNANTGDYQTAVGYEAGMSNTGGNTIFIGYRAGKSNSDSDVFSIQQTSVRAMPLIFGNLSTGNVSIGTTQTRATLQVNGSLLFPSLAGGTLTTDALGNVYVISDEKMKTDIKTTTTGLNAALNTVPITYKFDPKSGLDTKNTYSGFSAQNLIDAGIGEAILKIPATISTNTIKTPEQTICDISNGTDIIGKEVFLCRVVSAEYETKLIPKLDKDGNQEYTYAVNDRAIIGVSINAIKELNAKIEAQNATIAKQEARIAALEKKVGL